MKTRFVALAALLALSTVLIAGCGEDLVAQVQGVWKATEEKGRERGFIVIGKEKMNLDDDREVDIAMEEKDGKVALRRAGTDEVIGVVSVIDDDTLELALTTPTGSSKIRLKRSSKEEMDALYHPPLDKITGIWRTEAESGAIEDSSFIEIAPDAVSVNSSKTAGGFTTKKGVYLFSYEGGREPTLYSFNKDGKLVRSPGAMYLPQILVPSSAEEAAAAAQARLAAVGKHFGFWSKEQQFRGRAREYLEFGGDFVDDNGTRTAATPVYASGGVEWFQEGADSAFMTTRIGGDVILNASRNMFDRAEYRRADRDALEKLNNPELEHFTGRWILENPAAGSFRAVEIGPDFIVCDNRRERIAVKSAETNRLELVHPVPGERFAVILSHVEDGAGGGRIAMDYSNFGKDSFVYRRAEKSEYDAVAATVTDPLTVIPGFWRSEQPVSRHKNESVYATAAFALNVRGKKGDAVDWTSYHFISPRARNPSIDGKATVREGVFLIRYGRVANPVELTDDPNGRGSWVQIRVIGPDTLEISNDGRDFLRKISKGS